MGTQYIEDPQTKERIPFEWNKPEPPTSADIDSLFAAVKQKRTSDTQSEKIERSAGQRIASAIAPYARPVLEYGGMMAGGSLGAGGGTFVAPGAGSVAGGIAGAGIGYAAGRNVANALEEYAGDRKPVSVPRNFLNTGKDVATGAAMEVGGQVIGKAIEPAANWLMKPARSLYESAMKIPPASVPNEIRNKIVDTGIEGKYGVTQKGLDKLRGNIDALNKKIGNSVDSMTGEIDLKDAASRIDELKKFYHNLPQKVADQFTKPLDELKANFAEGGKITPKQAQEMKKTLYALNRKHYGELSGAITEGNKAVARGLKEELVKRNPELAVLNAKDSALINLEEVLERAVNRSRNYDIIRLGDTVMAAAGGSAGGARGAEAAFFMKRVLESPAVKSQLAFALRKANFLARRAGKSIATPLITRGASYEALNQND